MANETTEDRLAAAEARVQRLAVEMEAYFAEQRQDLATLEAEVERLKQERLKAEAPDPEAERNLRNMRRLIGFNIAVFAVAILALALCHG